MLGGEVSKGAGFEAAPPAGTVLADKYRVVGALGSGGMGCLVKAEHLFLKKTVAVKFLQANHGASAERRLFREARAAQALSSENVVRVFDLGVHEGAPFIVMELLEGTDLAARVRRDGPLAVEDAVDGILEACVAVAEAHAIGIVHRDLKPANLFWTRTATLELVKVLDFGISKVPDPVGETDCEKTAEDAVLGTPYYMSPEQLRNPAKIDARTDVWSLAVTLFHLLSGEHPFSGETPREVTATIFTDPPRDLRALRPEVPVELWAVIEAALAKRPEERTPSVAALVDDLVPFASKRGRLAAERVGAMGAPAPAGEREPSEAAGPMSVTGDGLSSTLRTAGEARETPARRDATGRAPVAAMGLAAVAVAGAIAWLVVVDRSSPGADRVRGGSSPGADRVRGGSSQEGKR